MHAMATVEALAVDGTLPDELSGVFLQASPHPTGGAGRVLTGIRLGGGRASWYRAAGVAGAEEFGPVLDLGDAMVARPVREAGTDRWHTVVTRPGHAFAEHLVLSSAGSVLRASSFRLEGVPFISAVAITNRFLIVLDLPVAHRRAAALLGTGNPVAWQPNRPARIGLLPLRTKGAQPRWFPIEQCYVFQTINAYDDGDRVVLDAIRHPKAFDGNPLDQGHACRWELDLTMRTARARKLTDAISESTVDNRAAGAKHREVFTSAHDMWGYAKVTRHDLSTWHSQEQVLGRDLRAGRPVFVPSAAHAGWLLVLVEDLAHQQGMLLVLDARLTEPPQAVVYLPVIPPRAAQTAWRTDG